MSTDTPVAPVLTLYDWIAYFVADPFDPQTVTTQSGQIRATSRSNAYRTAEGEFENRSLLNWYVREAKSE